MAFRNSVAFDYTRIPDPLIENVDYFLWRGINGFATELPVTLAHCAYSSLQGRSTFAFTGTGLGSITTPILGWGGQYDTLPASVSLSMNYYHDSSLSFSRRFYLVLSNAGIQVYLSGSKMFFNFFDSTGAAVGGGVSEPSPGAWWNISVFNNVSVEFILSSATQASSAILRVNGVVRDTYTGTISLAGGTLVAKQVNVAGAANTQQVNNMKVEYNKVAQ